MLNSMMKKCCGSNVDAGLLVLRIGVAAIFIFSGWMKVADLHSTVAMFATMGFTPFWAYLVSFVELLGGIAILLGVYTRIAAGLLTIVMIVAVYMVRSNIMMIMTPAILVFANASLALSGSGRYSLGRILCKCGNCESCIVKSDSSEIK